MESCVAEERSELSEVQTTKEPAEESPDTYMATPDKHDHDATINGSVLPEDPSSSTNQMESDPISETCDFDEASVGDEKDEDTLANSSMNDGIGLGQPEKHWSDFVTSESSECNAESESPVQDSGSSHHDIPLQSESTGQIEENSNQLSESSSSLPANSPAFLADIEQKDGASESQELVDGKSTNEERASVYISSVFSVSSESFTTDATGSSEEKLPKVMPIVIQPEENQELTSIESGPETLDEQSESELGMEALETTDETSQDTIVEEPATNKEEDNRKDGTYLTFARSDLQNRGRSVLDNLKLIMKNRPETSVEMSAEATNSVVVKPKMKFSCEICGKGFKYSSILDKHTARCSGKAVTEVTVQSVNMVESTMKSNTENENSKADDNENQNDDLVADSGLASGNNTEAVTEAVGNEGENLMSFDHIKAKLVDGEWAYICPVCTKWFKKRGALATHVRHHDGNIKIDLNNVKYHDSEESFNEESAAHVTDILGEASSCVECGKVFRRKTALESHMKNHQKEEEQLNIFASAREQKKVSEDGDGKYYCNECGVVFRRKSALEYHMKMHENSEEDGDMTSEAGSQGDGKSAKIDKALRALKARFKMEKYDDHVQEKRFPCRVIGCNGKFFSRKGLASHENKHRREGDKIPPETKDCTVDLTRVSEKSPVRVQDVKIVDPPASKRKNLTNILPVFNQNKNRPLQAGFQIKSEWYECRICNRKYKYESALHWHERSDHGIERPESDEEGQAQSGKKNKFKVGSGLQKGKSFPGLIKTIHSKEIEAKIAVYRRKRLLPNQCVVCRKIFRHKGAMMNHKKKTHSEAQIQQSWNEYHQGLGSEGKPTPVISDSAASLKKQTSTVQGTTDRWQHQNVRSKQRTALETQTTKPATIVSKPFVCGICGAGFAVLTELGNHMGSCAGAPKNLIREEAAYNPAPLSRSNSSASSTASQQRVAQKPATATRSDENSISEDEEVDGDDNFENPIAEPDGEAVPNKCYECGVVCDSRFDFIEHTQAHNLGKPIGRIPCKSCPRKFQFKASLIAHELIHSRGKTAMTWKCPECHKTYPDQKHLSYHIRVHTGEMSKCRICTMQFANPSTWMMHMKRHAGVKTHPHCPICNKQVGSKPALTYHLKHLHPDQADDYDINGKRIQQEHAQESFSGNFRNSEVGSEIGHVTVKKEVRTAEIQTQTDFGMQTDVDDTKMVMGEPDYYECFVCMKVFKEKKDLYGHMVVHGGDNCMCGICRKCFAGKGNLKIHLVKHADKIDNETCRCCGKIYSSKHALQVHASKHDFRKITFCPMCPKGFENEDELELHMEQCNGGEGLDTKEDVDIFTHQCTYCQKKFTGSYLLRQHLRQHTGEKPFVCGVGYCGKSFTICKSLKDHFQKIHPGEADIGMCSHCGMKFSVFDDITHHVTRQHKAKLTEGSIIRLPEIKPDFEPVGEFDDKGGIIYKCPVCKKILPSPGNVRTHLRIHTGERPFACNICKKAFKQIGNMKTHYKSCHPTTNYTLRCTICHENFTSLSLLGSHDTLKHGGGKMDHSRRASLGKRKKGEGITPSAKRSRRISKGMSPRGGGDADWEGMEMSGELSEMNMLLGGDVDTADMGAMQPEGADAEMNLEEEETTEASDQVHIKQERLNDSEVEPGVTQVMGPKGAKIAKCTYCGKTFQYLYLARDHVRTHTGEKPFKCNICNMVFTSADSMKWHFPKHEGTPVSAACLKCGESFMSVHDLKKHFLKEHVPSYNPGRRSSSVSSSLSDISRRLESRTSATPSPLIKQEPVSTPPATKSSEQKPYTCFCGIGFLHTSSSRRHFMDKHLKPEQNTCMCMVCQEVFEKTEDAKSHGFQKHFTNLEEGTVAQGPVAQGLVAKGPVAQGPAEPSNSRNQETPSNTSGTGDMMEGNEEEDLAEEEPLDAPDTSFEESEVTPNKIVKSSPEKAKRYKCKTCDMSFALTRELHRHTVFVHERKKLYRCKLCGSELTRLGNLDVHLKTVHKLTGDISFAIEEILPDVSHKVLDESLEEQTSSDDFASSLVEEGEDEERLDARESPADNSHKCAICGKGFRILSLLKRHMVVHSQEKLYPCPECGIKYGRKDTVYAHMKQAHGKEFRYESDAKTGLAPNMMIAPDPIVKAEFPEKRSFDDSEQRHSQFASTPPWGSAVLKKCGVCHKGFKSAQQLRIHVRVHTGERPFKCDVCGQTFRQLPHLNKHKLLHDDAPPKFQCHLCEKGYHQKSNLEFHLRNTHGNRKASLPKRNVPSISPAFKCQICGKGFQRNDSLMQHMTAVHQKEIFKCPICGEGFISPPELGEHITLMHASASKGTNPGSSSTTMEPGYEEEEEEEEYDEEIDESMEVDFEEEFDEFEEEFDEQDLAELAEFETASQSSYQGQVTAGDEDQVGSSGTGGKQFTCEVCGKKCMSYQALGAHQKAHKEGIPVCFCHDCGHVSKKKDHMMFHMTKHIDKRLRACKLCGIQKQTYEDVYAHMEEHMSENGVRCLACGKGFPSQAELSQHGCPKPQNKCEQCGMSFASVEALASHTRAMHSGYASPDRRMSASYACKVCGLALQSHNSLLVHLRTHKSNVKNVSQNKKGKFCPICRKTFYGLFNMQVHMATHSGEPVVKCRMCGKVCANRTQLSKHMLVHTGIKRFSCQHCGKKFAQRGNLMSHIDTHHTSEEQKIRFECELCGVLYRDRRSVSRHKETVHGITD